LAANLVLGLARGPNSIWGCSTSASLQWT